MNFLLDNNKTIKDIIKQKVINLINDNIDAYMFSDIYFKKMKSFLKNCNDASIITDDLIIEFTKEIMKDLLIVPYLYDLS